MRYWLINIAADRVGPNYQFRAQGYTVDAISRLEAIGIGSEAFHKEFPEHLVRSITATDITNSARLFVHLNPDPDWTPPEEGLTQ